MPSLNGVSNRRPGDCRRVQNGTSKNRCKPPATAQKNVEVKEIRLRPKTEDHHTTFKVRDARRWLESNKKVNVRIQFRGREAHYPEIALKMLEEIAEELSDVGAVEQRPSREGYSMVMVIAPLKE